MTAERYARPILVSASSFINDDVTELRDRDGGAGDNGTIDKDDLVQYVPQEGVLLFPPSDTACSRRLPSLLPEEISGARLSFDCLRGK